MASSPHFTEERVEAQGREAPAVAWSLEPGDVAWGSGAAASPAMGPAWNSRRSPKAPAAGVPSCPSPPRPAEPVTPPRPGASKNATGPQVSRH